MFNRLAVEGYFANTFWVEIGMNFFFYGFDYNQKSRNLDTASGTSGTRADKHKDYENRF